MGCSHYGSERGAAPTGQAGQTASIVGAVRSATRRIADVPAATPWYAHRPAMKGQGDEVLPPTQGSAGAVRWRKSEGDPYTAWFPQCCRRPRWPKYQCNQLNGRDRQVASSRLRRWVWQRKIRDVGDANRGC